MAIDTTGPHSRRALLAGAAGGLGGLVAAAIGRVNPVAAAGGDPIVLGNANDAGTSNTTIKTNSSYPGIALQMNNLGTGTGAFMLSTSGVGLAAQTSHADRYGASATNQAMSSGTGAAILATGKQNHGLVATTQHSNKDAITATSAAAAGVGAAIRATGGHNTGIEATSTDQFAVRGITTDSTAIRGESQTATGVAGSSGNWVGVAGTSTDGFAIWGESTNSYAGFFVNQVYAGSWIDVQQITEPGVAGVDQARLFVRDNGLGKSQLCVVFHTGIAFVLATEI
jgi:hypothetical protein